MSCVAVKWARWKKRLLHKQQPPQTHTYTPFLTAVAPVPFFSPSNRPELLMYWMLRTKSINKRKSFMRREKLKGVHPHAAQRSCTCVCSYCLHEFTCLPAHFPHPSRKWLCLSASTHISCPPVSPRQTRRADSLMFNAHSGSRHACEARTHTHTHPALSP